MKAIKELLRNAPLTAEVSDADACEADHAAIAPAKSYEDCPGPPPPPPSGPRRRPAAPRPDLMRQAVKGGPLP